MKKEKHIMSRRNKRLIFIVVTVIFIVATLTISVSAEGRSEQNIIDILNTLPLNNNNWFFSIFRSLGWLIIKGLLVIVNGLEAAIFSITDVFGGFLSSPDIQAISNKLMKLVVALFVFVIVFVGFQFLIKKQEVNTLFANFALGMIVFLAIPTVVVEGMTLTNAAIGYLNEGNLNFGSNVVVNNITDCLLYDQNDFGSIDTSNKLIPSTDGQPPKKNNINNDNIYNLDPNELINPKETKNKEVWEKDVVVNSDGSQSLTEVTNGIFGIEFMSSWYYRYHIDWFTIIVTLVVTAIALILSGIKIARLLFELVFHQLAAQVTALLDVYSGQRMKKCLQSIIAVFITLFGVYLMLQLYVFGTAWLGTQTEINIYVRLICLIAMSWAVIDGPALFEQLVGIDAGVNSATRALVGMAAAGRVAKGAANTTKGITKSTAKVAQKAATAGGASGAMVAGKVAGRVSAMRDSNPKPKEPTEKDKQKQQSMDKASQKVGALDANKKPDPNSTEPKANGAPESPDIGNQNKDGSVYEEMQAPDNDSKGSGDSVHEEMEKQSGTAKSGQNEKSPARGIAHETARNLKSKIAQKDPIKTTKRTYDLNAANSRRKKTVKMDYKNQSKQYQDTYKEGPSRAEKKVMKQNAKNRYEPKGGN